MHSHFFFSRTVDTIAFQDIKKLVSNKHYYAYDELYMGILFKFFEVLTFECIFKHF